MIRDPRLVIGSLIVGVVYVCGANIKHTYTNPTLTTERTFDGVFWRFEIERHSVRGWRIVRKEWNIQKDGWNNPKKSIYTGPCVIVNSDNGGTYFLRYQQEYIEILNCDPSLTEYGCILKNDNADDFQKLVNLVLPVAKGLEPQLGD